MNPQKLLIADADAKLVETLAAHFRSRGFEVKTAYDALTILKLVHLDTPDAFVLDINLQCHNGICVCELLSDERRFSFIPAILLTQNAEDARKHDCHDLRATYVAKGASLVTRVEQALSKVVSREPLVFAAT